MFAAVMPCGSAGANRGFRSRAGHRQNVDSAALVSAPASRTRAGRDGTFAAVRIHQRYAAHSVYGNHAAGKTLQIVSNLASSSLQGLVSRLPVRDWKHQSFPAGLQLLGHTVERLHQFRQFVGGADIHAVIELSLGKSLPVPAQRSHRPVDEFREETSASQVEANNTSTVNSDRKSM